MPIPDYQHLQIKSKAGGLSASDKRKVAGYEKKHKNRKGVLELLNAR